MENKKALTIKSDDIRYVSGIVFIVLSIYLLFSRKSNFSSLIDGLASGEDMYITILALLYYFSYMIIGFGILRKAPIISAIGIIAIMLYAQNIMSFFLVKYNEVTIIIAVGILLFCIYLTIMMNGDNREKEQSDTNTILEQISDLKQSYENHEISEDEFMATRNKINEILSTDVKVRLKSGPSFE